ncbi:MAG TPA: energy transducer TonB [Pyrinomonadaceae bacterium]|nr:energy transducer TonB [Pyrinomonadaceae bacterium]
MSSRIGSGEPGDNFVSEDDLKNLLERWITPEPPKTLDQRVANSYHMEFGNSESAQAALFAPSQEEVVTMKFCSTCKEEFADKFSFCPVDGTPLNAAVVNPEIPVSVPPPISEPVSVNPPMMAAAGAAGMAMAARDEFHFTFMDDSGLTARLAEAIREVAHESELTWPEFKKDPFGFTKRGVVGYSQAGWRVLSQPNVATGVLSALVIMIGAIIGVVLLDRFQVRLDFAQAKQEEQLILESMVDIPSEQPTPDVGTAGLDKGKGGGSKKVQEKPGGGGGGGRQDPKPASFGKTPQASLEVPQVVAPDPKPPRILNPALPVAATIVADPMLVPPDARLLPYGLRDSKSNVPSSGPGTGNGMGTGTGGGMGPGEGGGLGPGRGGNMGGGDRNDGGGGPGGGGGGTDYNRVFNSREVSTKAKIISRPEPSYTEDARKNMVTGTVVLRAIFGSGGQVTGIRTVSGLPHGLTERAIAAARNIKFVPATKDGRPVSMHIQIEYSFNLY